jgi:hypothetical protein
MNTYVGDVDLASSSAAATHLAATVRSTTAIRVAPAHAAAEPTAGRIAESRLGLPVFANVDESSHQVLVAERGDGILSLLPSRVFNDTTSLFPILVNLRPTHKREQPKFFGLPCSIIYL